MATAVASREEEASTKVAATGAGSGVGAGAEVVPGDAASEVAYPREEKFFGVCPLKFVEDILNAVDDSINDAVDDVESEMKATIPPASAVKATRRRGRPKRSESPAVMLQEACDKLVELMRKTLDKNFDMFEIYSLRNLLTLPPEALEDDPADAALTVSTGHTAEEVAKIEQNVEQLRRQVVEAIQHRRRLRHTQAVLEARVPAVEQRLRAVAGVVDELETAGAWPLEPVVRAVVADTSTLGALQDTATEHLASLEGKAVAAGAGDDASRMDSLRADYRRDRAGLQRMGV